jgi:hypothetical protein
VEQQLLRCEELRAKLEGPSAAPPYHGMEGQTARKLPRAASTTAQAQRSHAGRA